MKIPIPIIPVHTCELGGHQSISHTSQQNRVPLEPTNLFCNRLNGCIYGASRLQKGVRRVEERVVGEPGAPDGAQEGKTDQRNGPCHRPFGAFKRPNEESELPLKASLFLGRAARVPSLSFPSLPAAPPLTRSQTQAEAPAPRPAEARDSPDSLLNPVQFRGRRIIVEYCHLPNCSKRAPAPPRLVIIA